MKVIIFMNKYLNLVSIEYMPIGIFGFLFGFFVTQQFFSPMLILGLISFLFVVAGFNSYNAIIDKKIDSINKPNRPLPKNQLNEKDAFKVAIFSYALALLLSFFVNWIFFIVILCSVVLTILYSHPKTYLKKYFFVGTLSAVILYTVLAPLAGWAINFSGVISSELFIFLFLLGLPTGILKDYFDIRGDREHGISTIPVRLGVKYSLILVFLLYLLSLFYLFYIVIFNNKNFNFLYLFVLYVFIFINLKYFSSKVFNKLKKDIPFYFAVLFLILSEIFLMFVH